MGITKMEFVHKDIAYQVEAGFCEIRLWQDLASQHPKNLKILPIAAIPQQGCRRRIILDLSFPVYQQHKMRQAKPIQQSVNNTTERLALTAPVQEIGNVFWQVIDLLDSTEASEVVMLPS